jgi:transposase
VADIRQLEQRIAEVEAHIKAAVAQANTSLLGLFGVGPVLAATLFGDVGRFPSKHHFAAHTGTAPWRPPAARSSATGCPGPVTASSTMPCT